MATQDDERWFEVLAGRAAPVDRDTRQAASLREYIVQAQERVPELDAAAERRMMNLLHAKGAFAQDAGTQAAPRAVQQRTNAERGRWWHWLFPPVAAHRSRYAAMVAVAAAAVCVPIVLQMGSPGDGGVKSLRSGASVQVVQAAQPERAASELAALLALQGVAASVRSEGEERQLDALVPPQAREAVRTALVPRGIALPADGRLSVRFQRAR